MLARTNPVSAKLVVLLCGLAILFLSTVCADPANAQAIAEAAGATSVAGAVASGIKPINLPKFPTVAGPSGSGGGYGSSPHLIANSGPAPEVTNRQALQARAGKDAGKVLLRATPVEAQVWVDGKIVGKTPLLLVLPPGKYEVEMRGARGETGKGSVDLLPRETREMAIKLELLYPGRVKLTAR